MTPHHHPEPDVTPPPPATPEPATPDPPTPGSATATSPAVTRRPYKHMRVVTDEVAAALLPRILAALNEKDDSRGEVLADLKSVLADSHEFEGYRLARKLDNDYHWDANADLVDGLERTEAYARKVVGRLVADWIRRYNILPGHAVGDRVRFHTSAGGWGEPLAGRIVAVRPEDAEYIVQEDRDDPLLAADLTEERRQQILAREATSPCGYVIPYEQVVGDQPWQPDGKRAWQPDEPAYEPPAEPASGGEA